MPTDSHLDKIHGPEDSDYEHPNSIYFKGFSESRNIAVERDYLAQRHATLLAKYEELDKLKRSAEELQDRVKQMIEITDEDHGKAIRVFTIVTLVFLPMQVVLLTLERQTSC